MSIQPLRNACADAWKFCFNCSRRSLHSYLLSRMNQSANLERQIRELEDQLGELRAAALVAELLLVHGEELLGANMFESDPRNDEALTVYADTGALLSTAYRANGKPAQIR